MKSLINDIKTNTFRNIYLLYGEEVYLRNQYANKLKNALVSPDDTVNVTIYDGAGVSVTELIDQAETMPFFSDRRLLLIKNSGFFKNSQEELAAYLGNVPDTTYIIFVEDEVDKRGKLYKAVAKNGAVASFEKQTEETLKRWILEKIKQEKKQIRSSTMDIFLERCGTDMNYIATELEKLFSYTMGKEIIETADVEEICAGQTTNKIFEMITAIAEKKQRKALDLYYDLLTLKEPPMRILFLIARQFNMILQVKELQKLGYSQNAMADKLDIRGFIIKNTIRQASQFSAEEARYALERSVATEHDVKSGKLDDKLAVELIIVEMSRKRK